MKKRLSRIICWIIIPFLILCCGIFKNISSIPNTIFVHEGQEIESNNIIDTNIFLTKNIAINEKNNNDAISINLLGLFPVKSVSVEPVPDISLYPGGQPIGVKLNTKGVLVVALCDVETKGEKITSPAALAGIQVGDIITKVNNKKIDTAEKLVYEIKSSNGKEITVLFDRDGKEYSKKIIPLNSGKDNYKIGLWVRDYTSGVGTLTFYHKDSRIFGALGHPITDVDTGTILRIDTGEIVNSSIISYRKGEKGTPGELRGLFIDEDNCIGTVKKNTKCGIYGKGTNLLSKHRYSKPMKVALRNEIKIGPAKILTTIDGNEPELYDIEIEKLLNQEVPGSKSMVIRVTDARLLEETGGIVQGMSGSPIIQNGKIIGAVTHVLISRPDVGYGIYIEWMLKDAGIL
ncbi:SpoIVB peptidase [Clostridium sediminicola]|uniref:SpoIVB peptidase n=1 Tax=Clostridium sediminicola TaxID=3114879 RepID=UPI0031F207CD